MIAMMYVKQISSLPMVPVRPYGYLGKMHSWWTHHDDASYRQKAQCIIYQYNSYVVPGTGNMSVCMMFEPIHSVETEHRSIVISVKMF